MMNEITICPDAHEVEVSASATLGIDIEKASAKALFSRLYETCQELMDCHEPGTPEHEQFRDLGVGIIWLYSKMVPLYHVYGEGGGAEGSE